jgi:spermidine/putrescine transport system substrate-binding protein
MNRRQFHSLLAAAGLSLVVMPISARPANAAGNLSYYTWSQYNNPAFHNSFVKKYGGSPEMTFFGDEEEALQKILSGFTPDLAHPCSYNVGRWHEAGVIKPIDVSRLKYWPDIFSSLKKLEGTYSGDERWFVPWEWGNSSVIYRTDLVDPSYQTEGTWRILWDERYKGRLAAYKQIDGGVTPAALLAGAKNPFDLTDEEIEKVKELLIQQRSLLRFYWDDNTTVEQALASGEVVAAYGWNNSVQTLRRQGVSVDFMLPKEGMLNWVCGVVMINGGKGNEEAAYDFLNSLLEPETGKNLIETLGYGHSNHKSFELVSETTLKELGINGDPDLLLSSGVFLSPIPKENREKQTRMFEDVKAGF